MYRKVVFYDFIQKIISTNGRTGSLCDFFDCQPGAILSYEK